MLHKVLSRDWSLRVTPSHQKYIILHKPLSHYSQGWIIQQLQSLNVALTRQKPEKMRSRRPKEVRKREDERSGWWECFPVKHQRLFVSGFGADMFAAVKCEQYKQGDKLNRRAKHWWKSGDSNKKCLCKAAIRGDGGESGSTEKHKQNVRLSVRSHTHTAHTSACTSACTYVRRHSLLHNARKWRFVRLKVRNTSLNLQFSPILNVLKTKNPKIKPFKEEAVWCISAQINEEFIDRIGSIGGWSSYEA